MKTFLINYISGTLNLQEVRVWSIREDGIAIITTTHHDQDHWVGVNSKRLIQLQTN